MANKFVRKWNFDGAVRVLSVTDLQQIEDPESDLGAALATVLSGLDLEVIGNLPSGGATGELLKKLSSSDGDADWGTLALADIVGLQAALDAKADDTDLTAIIASIALKATTAEVAALTATVATKASASSVTSLTATVATKATAADVAALELADLADVGDTVPVDGNVPAWDADTGAYLPTSLANQYAAADPSTGQTTVAAAAPFTLFGFIVNEGGDPPENLPLGEGVPIIGFERIGITAVDLVPVLLNSSFGQGVDHLTFTLGSTLAIGDKLTLAVGCSNEATAINNFNITVSAGSVEQVWTTLTGPNSTAMASMCEIEVTGTVASGQTVTVTSRDSGNTATNRVHLLAALVRMPNTADDALDKQASAGAGTSSSSMTAITSGATATTTQASEMAIGVAVWNGSTSASRTLTGTNGWLELSEQESDNGSTSRAMAVFYKELTALTTANLTTLMTASDSTTGQWAAQVATFKAE